MSPQKLWWHYRGHLRRRWMQELLAAAGIATGVALVLAVQIANTSITASAEQITHAITGTATLQLSARDQRGLPATTITQVRAIPGVEHAAPMFEQRATIAYQGRRAPIDLIGVDASIAQLRGTATGSVLLGGLALEPGVLLPRTVGETLGIPTGATGSGTSGVTILVRGRAQRVRVGGVFGPATIGPLANAMVAAAYLPRAQMMAGLPDRITRVLVTPRQGAEQEVRAALETVAHGRMTVSPVDAEITALKGATAPNDQVTALFAAISVFVGLLFAFTAMALTLPERRRELAGMQIAGYDTRGLTVVLLTQALLLGAFASAVGLALGDVLSRVIAQEPPAYLSFAFTISPERLVPLHVLALAWLGGVIMTCVAALGPILEIRRGRPALGSEDGLVEPGQTLSGTLRRRLAVVAAVLVAATSVLLLLAPAATVISIAALALATLLVIPAVFNVALAALRRIAQPRAMRSLMTATQLLRSTTLRSLALAAIGGVAVFGSLAIEGAHRDLVRGLERNFTDYLASADVWVTIGGDENSLTTQTFPPAPDLERELRALPAVADLRVYHGGLLDIDGRRVWILGRPAGDSTLLPPSQLEAGDLATATRRLRGSGWVAVSRSVARAHRTGLGGVISLPTPTGEHRYHVAAILTNLGWGPGAIVLGASDYRSAFANADPAAYEIDLAPGYSQAAGGAAVAAVLGDGGALRAQTRSERYDQFMALARQGLERLSQISYLLLIAAALAMATAMGAAIWQRRDELEKLGIAGYGPGALWRTLMFETTIVLAIGCLTGTVTGTYGQWLLDRWLAETTGFPAPFRIGVAPMLATSALVCVSALLITAIPGYLASRAPAGDGRRVRA